jgi:hypothetical protein
MFDPLPPASKFMTALKHPGNSSRVAEHNLCRLVERRNEKSGRSGGSSTYPRSIKIDVQPAPPSGLDVASPIADHKEARAVEAEPIRRAPNHARFGLAAIATVTLHVITDLDCIDQKLLGEPAVYLFDHGLGG